MKSFLTRTLVAIPLIATFILLVFFQGWIFKIVLMIVMFFCQYEINSAVKQKIPNINQVLPFILTFLFPLIAYTVGMEIVPVLYLVYVMLIIIELIFNSKRDFYSLLGNIFIVVYPTAFFVGLIGINISFDSPLSNYLILITASCAVLTDTFAYIMGSMFGKRKLCPHISPKKTVEGAIYGYLLGFLTTVLLAIFTQKLFKVDIDIIRFSILLLPLPILAQLGDIFASLIKRYCDIKDFGSVFPGHGGFLDRLDSPIFVCTFIYLYFVLIFNINNMVLF